MNNEVLDNSLNWLVKYRSSIVPALLVAGMLATLAVQTFDFYRVAQDDVRHVARGNTRVSATLSENDTSQTPLTLADFSLLFGEDQGFESRFVTRELPKTSLNLTLHGALAGDATTKSSAIIQDSSGQDHFYQLGDSLPGGAILDQVHPHYVVIRYQGALQKLLFPDAHDKGLEMVNYPQTLPRPNEELPGPGDQYQERQDQEHQEHQEHQERQEHQENTEALEDRMEQLRQRLEQAQEN